MLPPNLQEYEVAVALDAAVPNSITGGKFAHDELTLEVNAGQIVSVCHALKMAPRFERLSTVTAVDRFPAEPRFELVYHLHSVSQKKRLRIKTFVGGTVLAIDSVTGVWRGANWYEREVFDLFGVTFHGHPNLRRIMLPEDWSGHPLRKDFPVTGERV